MLSAEGLISQQCFCCFLHFTTTAPTWSKCSTTEVLRSKKTFHTSYQNTLPHYSEEPQFTLKLKMVFVGTHPHTHTHPWSASPVAASLI